LDDKKQPFSLALKSAGKVMRESDAFCRRNSLINDTNKAGLSLYAGLTVRIQRLPVRPVHGPPRCPFVQDWPKQEPRERGWTQNITNGSVIPPGVKRSSGFIGTLGSLVAELDNKKQPFSLALKSAGKVMRESDAFCRRNSLINNIIKAGRSLNAGPNTTP